MQFIKSLSDGIGTAAGVAWPTFGIVFGTLSLATAGLTAFMLGVTSATLFAIVAVPTFIWSYNNYLNDQQQLKTNLQNALSLAQADYLSLLLTLIQENIIENDREFYQANSPALIANVKEKIRQQLIEIKLPLHSKNILNTLLNHSSSANLITQIASEMNNKKSVSNNIDATKLKHRIKNLIELNESQITKSQFKPATSNLLKVGFGSFCAGFGSIAGCATGTMGMLTSLGIFAGLAAVPVVGWATLGVAMVVGLVVAGICINNAYKNEININKLAHRTACNNHLESMSLLKRTQIDTRVEVTKKLVHENSNTLKRTRSADFNFANNSMWKNSADDMDGFAIIEPTSRFRLKR